MILSKLWNSRTFRLTGGVIIFLLAFGIAYLVMMDRNADTTQVHTISHHNQGCEIVLRVSYEYVTINETNKKLCDELKVGDFIIS